MKTTSHARTPNFALTAVLILIAAAFAFSLPFDWFRTCDDWAYVFANPDLGFSAAQLKNLLSVPVLGLYTPLPQLSYLIDFLIGGKTVWIYRFFNILYHLGAVYAVWKFFRLLGIGKRFAILGALAFGLHPQRIESVVWIAERKDVLVTFFFFMALNDFLCLQRKGKYFAWHCALLVLAACFCKPSAMALVPVMFLLHTFRYGKWDFRNQIAGLWKYLPCPLLYRLLDKLTATGVYHTGDPGSFSDRILLALRNYAFYFWKTFVPGKLYPLYPFCEIDAKVAFLIAGMIFVIAGVLVWQWKKGRREFLRVLSLLFCWGGMLLGVAGFVNFSNADFADRYNYIPSVFLIALFLLLLPKHPVCRRILMIWCAALAVQFFWYLPAWKSDPARLASCCRAASPNYHAAFTLASLKWPQEEAFALVRRVNPDHIRSQIGRDYVWEVKTFCRGIDCIRQRKIAEGYQVLDSAARSPHRKNLRQFRDDAPKILFETLSALDQASGRRPLAAGRLIEMSRCYPEDAVLAAFNAGRAARLLGRNAEARRCFLAVLAAASDHPGAKKELKMLEKSKK